MAIPVVDLSSILNHYNEDDRKKAVDIFGKACSEFGFLRIINHGVPDELISRSQELMQQFFDRPMDEKLECKPVSTVLPGGYGNMDAQFGSNEWLMVGEPCLGVNVFPSNMPQVGETLEEIFQHFQKLGAVVENMVNEYLSLPPGFLKKFNDDRSKDALICWRYPPAPIDQPNQLGRQKHRDTNYFTFVIQDDAGGLEYEKDGSWIPISHMEGSLVLNVGSVLEVLTNKKMVAAGHRVWKSKGKNRHSFTFFCNVGDQKWIEPFPQFAEGIGEVAKYRGFFFKELLQARLKKERDPLALHKEVIDLDHFAIPN